MSEMQTEAGPETTSKLRLPPRRERFRAEEDEVGLKAERVQLALQALPGWKLSEKDRVIQRVRDFPQRQMAALFAAFVSQLAGLAGQPVSLRIAGSRVVLSLAGQPRRGPYGGITESVLGLADLIG